ncbi:MAG: hypothetical protein K9W44_08675 [Candidatus Lokiarchaeota archaeon]|nr:hypothetical protein [Candidatus Harpocratesius repetitus]
MNSANAVIERDMKKVAFEIDWVKVSDQLENKHYYLDVAVQFERIFGSYGKVFTSDSNYDDGIDKLDYNKIASFRGGTTNGVGSIIFGENSNYKSDYCYAPDLSETGYELRVYLKLRTWYSYYWRYVSFGGSNNYGIWYTHEYYFDGYSGALTIRYRIVLY